MRDAASPRDGVKGRSTVARVVALVGGALLLALLGALVGLIGAFHHARTIELGGVALPVGVAAGLLALLLAQVVATGSPLTRNGPPFGAAFVSAGWLLCVLPLAGTRAEGDVVVPGDGRGAGFFWIGLLVVMVGPVLAQLAAPARPGRS